MRLGIIHPFLFRYARGIERFTFNLANALAQQAAEVHLLTWRWPNPVQIDSLGVRVQVHCLPTSRYFAAQAIVPFYVGALLRQACDFVWIFFAGYGEAEALTLVPSQRFGIVLHYPFSQVPHRYREFQRYRLARRADCIVSVSNFVAQGARAALGRESVVIQHGVNTQRFAPDSAARLAGRQALQVAPDAPLLLTVAALEERKGVQWVLRALPFVLEKMPDTAYVVVGDGPYRGELERLVRDLHLGQAVNFLGSQQDVAPYYQAADVSIILARGEASSLSTLESLACEVPVIAARQPPFGELITPECGLQVTEEDAEQVAEAILSLLVDPVRRQALGQAGRARVQAEFTWARAAEGYLHLANSFVS
jgi:glycosyltransferase involved in cell wall biosynthesis